MAYKHLQGDLSYTMLPFSVRSAILQQLGFKAEDGRFESLFFDSETSEYLDLQEKFRYMIISKSMVDDYESKKHSLSKPPIQKKNHLEHIRKKAVALKASKHHKDPLSFTCNETNFYAYLVKACNVENFKLIVPQSILIGFGFSTPFRL